MLELAPVKKVPGLVVFSISTLAPSMVSDVAHATDAEYTPKDRNPVSGMVVVTLISVHVLAGTEIAAPFIVNAAGETHAPAPLWIRPIRSNVVAFEERTQREILSGSPCVTGRRFH